MAMVQIRILYQIRCTDQIPCARFKHVNQSKHLPAAFILSIGDERHLVDPAQKLTSSSSTEKCAASFLWDTPRSGVAYRSSQPE